MFVNSPGLGFFDLFKLLSIGNQKNAGLKESDGITACGGVPKRLSKNAIHYSDTGFIIAFLATANEDA